MKKSILLFCTILIAGVSFAFNPTVNEKVLKSFNETFTNVKQAKWEEHKDHYTVRFVNNGVRAKINYDKKGRIISALQYYLPNRLPLNLYSKLKKQYRNETMFGVTEVTYGESVIYLVTMEDDKNWMTVKIDNTGTTMVYEKFKKAI